jgi:hypothetical protein
MHLFQQAGIKMYAWRLCLDLPGCRRLPPVLLPTKMKNSQITLDDSREKGLIIARRENMHPHNWQGKAACKGFARSGVRCVLKSTTLAPRSAEPVAPRSRGGGVVCRGRGRRNFKEAPQISGSDDAFAIMQSDIHSTGRQ